MNYSIIVPVYNRPEEVKELLDSLTLQEYENFEVLIIEDGSKNTCSHVIEMFRNKLNLFYYFKENEGPGPTRNFGSERASGDYLIFFDSDCLVPSLYLKNVDEMIKKHKPDAFGGPDAAHENFTPIQKAISYSMTSFFTTGGIRGKKRGMDKFHPRSFNMGISKQVYSVTGGFRKMRFGEDIDFSLRIIESGFRTMLFEKAFVYHKRRTNFRQFFKQVFNSGIARINLNKRHPGTLKMVHILPSLFLVFNFILLIGAFFQPMFLLPVILYAFIVFIDSLRFYKSFKVSLLSIIASYVQLFGYGSGFINAFWKRKILGLDEFHAYEKNFYK